jgi:hypothetical protein
MTARQRLSSEAGYSLVEMLVASAIMLAVTGAIFGLVNPSQGTADTQPEQSDLQQRMRIGNDILFKELMMTGAGPYFGSRRGSLLNFFAPVLPRRTGLLNADEPHVVKDDVVTLAYVPNTFSQTSIAQAMPPNSPEMKVTTPPNCPGYPVKKDLCGFEIGDTVIIFDSSGIWETFTLTQVQSDAAHLQHRGQQLDYEFPAGSTVTQIVNDTYYLDRNTNQLLRYDGGNSPDVPLVDNVVDLRFEYFGDVNPPLAPKPPVGTANCLYDAAGNYTAAMPVLAADEGSLAILTPAMLSNGPWCGSVSNEFDADLLRVRKLRVTLRMQAASRSLRGSGPLFFYPGTSQGGNRMVPDYIVRFDVTPRNLNLIR